MDWTGGLQRILDSLGGSMTIKGGQGIPSETTYEPNIFERLPQMISDYIGRAFSSTGEAPNPTPTPTPTPMPTPTPTPTPTPQPVGTDMLQAGFEKWRQPAPPIATMSGQLAQTGEGLPDPLLPAILALIESGGLTDSRMAEYSNPFGVMSPGTNNLVRYPDLQTAISGGNGRLGFEGLLRPGGIYEDYLQSGDINDFFRHWTPEGPGNPTPEELEQRYNILRSLFTQNGGE